MITLINQYLKNQEPLHKKPFLKCRARLDTLVTITNDFDQKEQENTRWITIRRFLMKEFIQPFAHKGIHSKKSQHRLWAIQGMQLCLCAENESDIIRLMHDDILMVRIFSVSVAIKLGSDYLVNHALKHIAYEKHFSPAIYKKLFKDIPEPIVKIVLKRLNHETDVKVLAVCYQILAMHMNDIPQNLLIRDVKRDHSTLTLAIVDVMHYMKRGIAIPVLQVALKNKSPAIKSSTLIGLRIIKAVEAIHDITALLYHEHRWVRYNAAYTLWGLGEQGLSILKSVTPKDGQLPFDMAQEILKIPAGRKEHYCRIL